MRWHTKNEEKKYFFYEKSDQSLKASQKFSTTMFRNGIYNKFCILFDREKDCK